MKKFIAVLVLCSLLLSACGSKNEGPISIDDGKLTCSKPYSISGLSSVSLNLKAKVIAENFKNITSNNGGNVEYLNCVKGEKVNTQTLIAKIKPDYNDPNVQNLVNQSNMINSQITNTNDIIISTKSNFDTQTNSLGNQKSNLESQLKILNDSLKKMSEQKDFGVSDIDKQLGTLQIQLETIDIQIEDLNKTKAKLEDSKKSDLSKLNLNLTNTRTQTKSLISDTLLKIDEIFGISPKNESINDQFEDFLSAKNSSLKNEVNQTWSTLNKNFQSFDSFSENETSDFLDSLNKLIGTVQDSIKNSIVSINFSQQTIDNYYSIFLQYGNNVVNTKNGIDNIVKSLDTIKNTYDTQILSLNTQINGSENSKRTILSNIDNIKSNKIGTYTTSIDLQKNQIESQIQNIQSNISTISSQVSSISSQEQIQLNQLSNQLSQLKASLNTININLAPQTIYSTVNGIVKEKTASIGNKVGPNSMLCQILPDEESLKIQIYSSYDLSLPMDISFDNNSNTYTTKITTKLSYQDNITQNYIYETSNDIFLDKKVVNLTKIFSEGKTLDIKTLSENKSNVSNKIFIPINYISNTINGTIVKIKDSTGNITEKSIVLGELNGNNIEVRTGLKFGDVLCN